MSLFGTIAGLGGTALGAFVGSLIYPGIGTAIGAMIGGSLGSIVGNTLFPDKIDINHPAPPKPHESRLQISTYGTPIPIVYGSSRLAGNIIYMSDVVETVDRSRHRQDGVRYYEMVKTYTSTFAIAFCEGPVEAIARIWVNGKIFCDWRDPDGPYYPAGSYGLGSGNLDTSIARSETFFSVYFGTETQSADPTLSGLLGAAETPTYRGICYIVFIDFPVGEFSGVPKIEIEIAPSIEVANTDLTITVANDNDNGWIWALGSVRHDSILVYNDSGGRLINEGYIRFAVNIPAGAHIASAVLYVHPTGGSSYPTSTLIRVETVDSAAQIASVADFDGRTWSTAYSTWTLASGPGYGPTVDISSLVQSIVDRSGWASGNYMQFKLSPLAGQATDKVLVLYDYSEAGSQPQLKITYGPW